MISIGIVTVLFNSDSVLNGFLESLSQQDNKNYVVYLVDNSYTNESTLLIQELTLKWGIKNKIQHIVNNENVGVARGNNQGIELAIKDNCEYILLANNDIEFREANLFDFLLSKTAKYKIVAPKILYHNTNKIWFAGAHIDKYRGLVIHDREFEEDVDDEEKYVEYAPTCFLMVAKEVFNNVGLMDEKYFVYWDDTDFIYRANNYGYKVLYSPDYTISHKVSISTGGRASLFSTYYFLRNRLYFIKKHFLGTSYFCSLFYTYTTTIIKIIFYDIERKKTLFKALKDSKHM